MKAIAITSLVLTTISAAPVYAWCSNSSQCDDGNVCTNDTCWFGSCYHFNAATGTSCDLDGQYCTADYCLYGQCQAGGPPQTPELCTTSLDDDCDGLTNEREPTGAGICEGPRGVYETGSTAKLGPAPFDNIPFNQKLAAGEDCDYSEECESAVCFPVPNDRPRCIDRCVVYQPAGWEPATVQNPETCNANEFFATACLPPMDSYWFDPVRGAGNNGTGVSCQFDSDCTSDQCVRAGLQAGRCATSNFPCPSGYLVGEVNWQTCLWCSPPLNNNICVPPAAGCIEFPADNCTQVGSGWSCP